MAIKNKIRKILSITAVTLFGLIVPNVLISFTSGFNKDFLAYNINDFNKNRLKSVDDAPYIRITQKDTLEPKTKFNDLYNNFYYNAVNYGIRQYILGDVTYNNSTDSFPITIHTQSTFSVTREDCGDKEKSHRVDNGLFHAYYGEELLPNRSYLNTRNNDDAICYISDSFADMLIKDLNLEKGENGYRDLVLNHSSLALNVNGIKCSFSINNILYTSKRSAPRCCQFNNLFCLAHISNRLIQKIPSISSCFEIDLKNSAFCITSVLNGCENLGYSTEDYQYSFFKKNLKTMNYEDQIEINKRYESINNRLDALFISLYIFAFLVTLGLLYLVLAKISLTNKNEFLIFCSSLLFLTIISIVSSLTYIYFVYTICPLFMLGTFTIIKKRGIAEEIRLLLFKEKNLNSKANIKYYEFQV